MSILKNAVTRKVRGWVLRGLGADGTAPPKIRLEYDLFFRYLAKHVGPDSIYVECGPAVGEGAAGLIPRLGFKPENCFLIEACPRNCALIREKVPGCTVSNLAVASSRGRVDFYVYDDPREPGSSRSNSLDAGSLIAKNMTNLRRIQVDSIGLTDYFADHGIGHCTYLHLNIEGGEYDLFTGDLGFLDKCQFVFLDLHSGLYMSETTEEGMTRRKCAIYDQLAGKGFELIAGYRREDIPLYQTHQTSIWENRRS
jgi:FkbM family methyltransferase